MFIGLLSFATLVSAAGETYTATAQVKSGFYLGLLALDVAASGPGHGELSGAAKVTVNDQGAIVTQDYSGEVVQLQNVTGK